MSAPYMPLYVGDYLADTVHLSRSEHGAYMLLLMAMWRAGGRLPADDGRLAKLSLCTPAEWLEIRSTVLEFFKRRGGHITHKRLSEEMAKYENRIVRSSKGGKSTALKKANKNNDNLPILVEPKVNQPEPEPIEIIDTNVSKSLRARGAPETPKIRPSKSCPTDWQPSQADFAVGEDAGLSPATIDQQLAMFRDHEFKTPKSNWSAAFRNWLRRSEEMSLERPSQNRAKLASGGLSPSETRRAGAALAIAQRRAARGGQDDDGSGSSSAQVLSFRGAEVGAARA